MLWAPKPSKCSQQPSLLLLAIVPTLCGSRSTHRLLLLLRRLLLCCRLLLLALGGWRRHTIEHRGLSPWLQQRAAVAWGRSGEEELLPAQPGQQAAALLEGSGGGRRHKG